MDKAKQKRVLLLHPPGKLRYQRDTFCSSVAKGSYAFPPGDLLLLSGSFGADVHVEALDALAEGLDPQQLRMRLDPQAWDLIVVQTATASWPEDAPVLRWLGERGARVALNGDYALTHAAAVLGDPDSGVSAVVEDMFAGGLGHWLQGAAHPPGLLLRDQPADATTAPIAALRPRHGIFPLRRYSLPWAIHRPVTTVYASLGCPMHCAFCLAGTTTFRRRPTDDVLAELHDVRRAGAKEVVFFDSLFNAQPSRARELTEAIRLARLGLSWSCFSRVDLVDEDTARQWRAAGCHTVLLGLESGSDRVLARMNKQQTTADARRAVAILRRAGLRVCAFFLLGYEGETDAEIAQTVQFAASLDLLLASFQAVVPFAGTPLGEALRDRTGKILDPVGFDDDRRPMSLAEHRTPEQLAHLCDQAYRTFYLRPGYVANRALMLRSASEAWGVAREAIHLVRRRRS